MSKWTIGIVNYHSSVYIKWQLKILYEFNNQDDFSVIIVDNSNDNKEFSKIHKISSKYSNITIIKRGFFRKIHEGASMQHGIGLDCAMHYAKLNKSKLFLSLDPDCFILRRDFLHFFEKKILEGNVFVGTAYSSVTQKRIKHPSFPCAFACVYDLEVIGYDNSFTPSSNLATDIDKSGEDVGYMVREKFFKLPYISFKQGSLREHFIKVSKIFRKDFEYYFFQNKIFAVHFNKTSRKVPWKLGSIRKVIYPFLWNRARFQNAKKCFNFINKS